MRKINKNAPPPSFTTYIQKRNPQDANYRPTYETMDTKTKEDLKKSLLNEQGWVCGYCQQTINMARMTIEHHCERSICNGQNGSSDKTLDYTNLMAVCQGKAGSNILHCDSNKATDKVRSKLPISLSPWNQAHINEISYNTKGTIKSTNSLHDDEINNVLNLNTKHLKDLRSKKFISIFKNSRHVNATIQKEKMRRILETDLQFGDNKFSNQFPGMSEYMRSKYCIK